MSYLTEQILMIVCVAVIVLAVVLSIYTIIKQSKQD
jgi:hypothetical protein